ncbi:flagellar hook-length control protein FliK [Pseudomonas sp. S 311-6]|uniref:flagellar hook-length control protein FliK n=1 Tax=Pseudomonas TaxID=286 RepID=UPI001CE45CA2|nr:MULTISPECIES: flagellar hook-length control protein FliK [Pseudomonas]MCO7642344.1 flagellar hook-length control protein FliK [Pseudomonas sp. S 311-6]MCO7567337.1 flagellar hook-length control protein FliK [Pseudomonas mosselii]MCO7597199.1 flagellar hook-length control protein FliK [Pseudomonas guariconensis]MCO7618621.1 flagellar hook-length control protein FliK [Pseudomonas guariconensis]MCU7222655.1 flagellar hook-length control protein FliK [Pseudomonas brassicacearum]
MTEINSLGAQTAVGLQAGKAAMTGELLRLLQPQPGLLAPGETARAEVMALRQVGQDFQLLLRLIQANGSQVQLQATASQPLPQGSLVTVSQTESNRLAVMVQQVNANNVATLTRLDNTQVPVGTLLQGKVLTSQALAQLPGEAASFRSLVTLLNSSQAGATLTIDSPRALPVGSLLSAVVQGDQSLRFVPLSGRQEQLSIAQQLISQQGRQASLPGLLNALQQVALDPGGVGTLRATAEQLLASLPDARQLGEAKAVAQALNNSGAFLEAKLLGGLSTELATDLKAQLLRLMAQASGNGPFLASTSASTLTQVMPAMARGALGMLERVGPRQQPGTFPLPSRLLQAMENEGDLQQLLRLAAAAIARLQSHALSSLQQSATLENGNLQTTWQTEIPIRHGQEFIPLQAKLQREETPQQHADRQREPQDPLQALWRIELAFDLALLGPLQVQAQLSQGRLSGQLWAEREQTAKLIDSQLGGLRERLLARGLDVGDLECHPGIPPQGPRTRVEQRWVDETA